MGSPDVLPKARAGLLVADHEKMGRRFITVLDRARERVSLLEPWEHAVLVLSDGTRRPEDIAQVVRGGVAPVGLADVNRCLEFFEREGLVEGAATPPPAGPRTLAGLQAAYHEWHRDPLRTGRILTGEQLEPFPEVRGPAPVDLQQPTVARAAEGRLQVGATFMVGSDGRAARSLLGAASDGEEAPADESFDVEELLRAVDHEISAFEQDLTLVPPPRPRATGGEASIPAGDLRPAVGSQVMTRPPGHAPTVVGRAPTDPRAAPRLMAPARDEPPDTDAPTLGGSFEEETLLGPERRPEPDQHTARDLESPARRGFSGLVDAARAGAEGRFFERIGQLSATELAGLLAHLRGLREAEPGSGPVAALVAAVEICARGDRPSGPADGGFAAAVSDLVGRGRCPRCSGRLSDDAPPCPACGYVPDTA